MTTLPERLLSVLQDAIKTVEFERQPYRAWHGAARDVIAVAAQALQAAPEGWVLVPREPTEAMLDAGLDWMPDYEPAYGHMQAAYAAMLTAAPSPSAALQAGGV